MVSAGSVYTHVTEIKLLLLLYNRRVVVRRHFPSMEEFQTELSVVEEYLLRGTYLDGFSKRKCRNNFKIEDDTTGRMMEARRKKITGASASVRGGKRSHS